MSVRRSRRAALPRLGSRPAPAGSAGTDPISSRRRSRRAGLAPARSARPLRLAGTRRIPATSAPPAHGSITRPSCTSSIQRNKPAPPSFLLSPTSSPWALWLVAHIPSSRLPLPPQTTPTTLTTVSPHASPRHTLAPQHGQPVLHNPLGSSTLTPSNEPEIALRAAQPGQSPHGMVETSVSKTAMHKVARWLEPRRERTLG